jgi:hypothetical protein
MCYGALIDNIESENQEVECVLALTADWRPDLLGGVW